ncbi:MAG: zf-HC2 domain-containing protein [Clostridia bacterium]|nr:zf-HC2 domain-containing protein [Clostridia bacterium]
MSDHTLKQECALARALMPLEIEGIASEESARYVKGHIDGCTDCAVAYGEERERQRQAALDAAEKEAERFRQDMLRMKKKRMLHRALRIAGAVVLALALLAGGAGLRAYLTDYYQFGVSPEECGVTLYRLENNCVVGRYEYEGNPFRVTSGFGFHQGTFQINNWTSAIRHPLEESPFFETMLYWWDGGLYQIDPKSFTYLWTQEGEAKAIFLGDEVDSVSLASDDRVIWRAGDDMPLYEGEPKDAYGDTLPSASQSTKTYTIRTEPAKEAAREEE